MGHALEWQLLCSFFTIEASLKTTVPIKQGVSWGRFKKKKMWNLGEFHRLNKKGLGELIMDTKPQGNFHTIFYRLNKGM